VKEQKRLMRRKPARVYVDTSVLGGVFDEEFSRASYNAVNVREGYSPIGIHTPQEVIEYEKEKF
jgi:hypothetical protein